MAEQAPGEEALDRSLGAGRGEMAGIREQEGVAPGVGAGGLAAQERQRVDEGRQSGDGRPEAVVQARIDGRMPEAGGLGRVVALQRIRQNLAAEKLTHAGTEAARRLLDGRMTERATLPGLYGSWSESIESVNSLVDDLVRPTTEVGRVIAAVAQGDLSQSVKVEGKDEVAQLIRALGHMVQRLRSVVGEVRTGVESVRTQVAAKLRSMGYPEKGSLQGFDAGVANAKSFVSCAIGRMS